jgi:hypothetical protein
MRAAPQVHRMRTVLLADLLATAGAPAHIEFLSLDTEGSEYGILSTFPWDRYTFGAMVGCACQFCLVGWCSGVRWCKPCMLATRTRGT